MNTLGDIATRINQLDNVQIHEKDIEHDHVNEIMFIREHLFRFVEAESVQRLEGLLNLIDDILNNYSTRWEIVRHSDIGIEKIDDKGLQSDSVGHIVHELNYYRKELERIKMRMEGMLAPLPITSVAGILNSLNHNQGSRAIYGLNLLSKEKDYRARQKLSWKIADALTEGGFIGQSDYNNFYEFCLTDKEIKFTIDWKHDKKTLKYFFDLLNGKYAPNTKLIEPNDIWITVTSVFTYHGQKIEYKNFNTIGFPSLRKRQTETLNHLYKSLL